MLDLVNPSFRVLPVKLLRQFLTRIEAEEGVVKVSHPIFIFQRAAFLCWDVFQ